MQTTRGWFISPPNFGQSTEKSEPSELKARMTFYLPKHCTYQKDMGERQEDHNDIATSSSLWPEGKI
jgi:hypothetical protein